MNALIAITAVLAVVALVLYAVGPGVSGTMDGDRDSAWKDDRRLFDRYNGGRDWIYRWTYDRAYRQHEESEARRAARRR